MEESQYVSVTHHYPEPDRIRLKVERNSKGYNWEVSVSAGTVAEAMELIGEAEEALKRDYGTVAP